MDKSTSSSSSFAKITTPFTDDDINSLKCGDMVYITGTVYTARDAAHKRIAEMLEKGISPPFELENQVVYYAGPCPAPPGKVIGSVGPTTSGRMDLYSPQLIERGLKIMIGKGLRSESVVNAIKKHGGIYFAAIGGAAALMSKCVKSVEIVAFEDLGTEAVRQLYVEDFPAVVANDSRGNSVYMI